LRDPSLKVPNFCVISKFNVVVAGHSPVGTESPAQIWNFVCRSIGNSAIRIAVYNFIIHELILLQSALDCGGFVGKSAIRIAVANFIIHELILVHSTLDCGGFVQRWGLEGIMG